MDPINTKMRKVTYIKHLEGITLSFESRLSTKSSKGTS